MFLKNAEVSRFSILTNVYFVIFPSCMLSYIGNKIYYILLNSRLHMYPATRATPCNKIYAFFVESIFSPCLVFFYETKLYQNQSRNHIPFSMKTFSQNQVVYLLCSNAATPDSCDESKDHSIYIAWHANWNWCPEKYAQKCGKWNKNPTRTIKY